MKKIKSKVWFLLLPPVFLSSFLAFSNGWAQEEHTDALSRRETKAEQTAQKAARESKVKSETEPQKRVTFEDVLADPGNINLNVLYAQSQAASNDLLGAATTLERILIINPNLQDVRLFYAIVLFRLDNLTEASRELEVLAALKLEKPVEEEVKAYQKQIRLRGRKTRFGVRQTFGFEIDDNRNAASSSKFRLLAETPVGNTGTSRREDDTSFLNITRFDVVRDLGFQAGHEVFASFTYFLQEQTEVDSLDLQSIQHEYGATLKTSWFHFTPKFYANHIHLSRESFLRTQGLDFQIDRQLTSRLDIAGSFDLERQEYLPITENAAGRERKGRQISYDLDANYLLKPTMRVSAGMGYANKDAKAEYNGYERLILNWAHTWLLGRGQFLINAMAVNFDYYDEPDTAIAGRYRKDKALRYRVTYGAPLEFLQIGKILPQPFRDITWTFSYEFFRSVSTITNFTYRNHKYQMLLTKQFEF